MALYDVNESREDDDELVGDGEPFVEVYDRAVARVVACRQREANKKAQHKLAKDELTVALEQLQALRGHKGEPRQRPLPGIGRR